MLPTERKELIESCAKIAHNFIGREPDDLDVAEEIEHRILAQIQAENLVIDKGQIGEGSSR